MVDQSGTPLVLVVDDQPAAAEMLTRLFNANGYEVANAYNGTEALSLAHEIQPDLILLDIMMPGMDGFEVLKHLRDKPDTADIPTIFITAKTNLADIEHGLQLGADDYIPKPVKPRELLARAKSKIESHKLREELRKRTIELEGRTTDLQALLRVSEELNTHLEIDELLNLLLLLVQDLIPTQVAAVFRFNESRIVDELVRSKDGDDYTGQLDLDVLFEKLKSSQAVAWNSTEASPITEFPAGMSIGLAHNGKLHGLIAVFSDEPYSDHILRLFEGIGRQAAMALRNAVLFQLEANYNEELKATVAERTAELQSAHEQLIRSEKLASVGRLAAGIAHEINNPLLPILVNMELMLEDIHHGSEISVRDIEESLRSAQRISRIVQRLLQFTRKRGEDVPDMEELNVAKIIDDVVALSSSYIKKDGINIVLNVDPATYILGNRDQLEQVFLNLIVNAKAAMSDGGTLEIRTETGETDVTIFFRDEGVGIETDDLQKIFEPFYSTKEDGSGLGLFISHGIMTNHNGAIDVVSELGKGTTFILTLPIIQKMEETA